ncbi:hypothetical protein GCM10011494_21930 [Novosphingobium endophyticum]|uniref:DUF1214 domain-containing protein n=1 Tax=Novosphingobium endophyticum TaxID=1955250 RepID=A0A916TSP2_9SPHN|nr:DUF1214 domain-containing protein [Novosphingobium endophyticum]GGC03041.1 hypothetical protein GCM10011494_21930 [Novosphingobium endophyticum]
MKDWPHYVDLLKGAEQLASRLAFPDSDLMKAQLWRQFAMNIAQGYFLLFQSSPDHPEFAPFENSVFLAQPNPDAVYYYAPVDGRGVYRVVGERGNAPVAGFALGSRIIGMDALPGRGLGNHDMDDLSLDADGKFEVIFSTERPAGYGGDWRPMDPETDFIMARQFSYDWGRERDVVLAIERLDAVSPIRPALSAEEIDAKLTHLLGGYARNLSGICLGAVNRCAKRGFINRFNLNSYQELGNGEDWPQTYWETVFDIAGDEALIIESDLPERRLYWNVQVIDGLWNQVDYVYQQSSLNGHQAVVDSDGRFRAVLSHRDPGIANWLDTGGNLYGMMIGRWYRCSSEPLPAITKVKFADLDQHLPEDTPRIGEAERAEALRKRRIGSQLRRKW